MRYFVTLAVAIGLMSYIDLPGLLNKKMTKELTVWIVLTVIGSVITLIYSIFDLDFSVFTDLMIKLFSLGQ